MICTYYFQARNKMELFNKKHYTVISDSLSVMKRQILWKRIDIIGQCCMLIIPQFLFPIVYAGLERVLFGLFIALFTVGGWQVVSALLHVCFFPKAHRHSERKVYNILLIGALLLMVPVLVLSVSTFNTDIFSGLASGCSLILLFVGPLMAIGYFCICVPELKRLLRIKAGKPPIE